MIDFRADDKGYFIKWNNEPYDCLYLFYEPFGTLFEINDRRILPKEIDRELFIRQSRIVVPSSEVPTKGEHSSLFPMGRYRLCICGDREALGKLLMAKEVHVGGRIRFEESCSIGRGGMERLSLRSTYCFGEGQIFLRFFPDTGLGERIYLPEMEDGQDGLYYTGCILPPNAYGHIGAEVIADLRGCVEIIRI